ncbi:MAG: helix-hairpin-helix domain-containing protein [Chromatiales bacterium]|nr:MAG: helix-hairpin-helix domain-containing protein [Chromatiales bacterium]
MRSILSVLAGAASLLPLLAGAVDINNADAETLAAELNGVGVSRAEAIIEYREAFGAFQAPEDLLNVRGIGLQILDANRDNIEVGAMTQ